VLHWHQLVGHVETIFFIFIRKIEFIEFTFSTASSKQENVANVIGILKEKPKPNFKNTSKL